jgi:hypothetical protein
LKKTISVFLAATFVAINLTTAQAAGVVNLADIVGGGNGLGTGTLGHGIDPSTGGTAPPALFQISQPNNTNAFHSSTVNFVNGVFIPDGGAASVTLDSAGHAYSGFPNTDSNSWDLIKDGPNQNSGTTLNSVDYNSGSNSMIGLHANKGISFDLQQIEAANPTLSLNYFTAFAGMSHFAPGFGYGTADWWVFVDGVLKQSEVNTPGGVGFAIAVPITSADHFLTLVSTDHGDVFLNDQVIFGNPQLQTVPEPSAFVLSGLGALGILAVARRYRCSA